MAKNKKIEIYDLDYLVNTELTEEDLYNIFETPSLNYSFIYIIQEMLSNV